MSSYPGPPCERDRVPEKDENHERKGVESDDSSRRTFSMSLWKEFDYLPADYGYEKDGGKQHGSGDEDGDSVYHDNPSPSIRSISACLLSSRTFVMLPFVSC